MKLTSNDIEFIRCTLEGIYNSDEAALMKRYIQHGRISTYCHVMGVVCLSYVINQRLHLNADKQSLIVGAFMHDFYLYDWHVPAEWHRLHGFRHPRFALENAMKKCELNLTEQNIISSHMWPLTITKLPRCREAVIVCLSDKICTIYEVLFRDHSMYDPKI